MKEAIIGSSYSQKTAGFVKNKNNELVIVDIPEDFRKRDSLLNYGREQKSFTKNSKGENTFELKGTIGNKSVKVLYTIKNEKKKKDQEIEEALDEIFI